MLPQRRAADSPGHAGPAAATHRLRGGQAAATAKIAAFPAQRVVVTGQTPPAPAPMTYREAGVDIDAGNELVERIKPQVRRSFRPEVMGGRGGIGNASCRERVGTYV